MIQNNASFIVHRLRMVVASSLLAVLFSTLAGCFPIQSPPSATPRSAGISAAKPTVATVLPEVKLEPLPKEDVRSNSNEDSLMYHDIPYHPGNTQQQLSLFLPLEAQDHPDKLYPVLFLAHHWKGSKEGSMLLDVMRFANQLGYAAVTVDYRDDPANGNPWTAHNDGACALAWIYANADNYKLDVDRMAAFGNSYGAVIATDLALASDPNSFLTSCPNSVPVGRPFKGIIPFAIGTFGVPGEDLAISAESTYVKGIIEDMNVFESEEEVLALFTELAELPPAEWASSTQLSAEARAFAQTMPAYWLDTGDPPFLLLYPEREAYWTQGEYDAFAKLLEETRVKFTYLVLPGASRVAFSLSDPASWQEPIQAFLDDLFFDEPIYH